MTQAQAQEAIKSIRSFDDNWVDVVTVTDGIHREYSGTVTQADNGGFFIDGAYLSFTMSVFESIEIDQD